MVTTSDPNREPPNPDLDVSTSATPRAKPSVQPRRVRPAWQEPADQAAGQMLKLHLDNLRLRFALLSEEPLEKQPREKAMYVQIQSALTKDLELTWDDAFRIESQIGCLLEGDRLRQEIRARLRWATTDGVPHVDVLQNDYASLLKTIEERKLSNPDDLLRDFWLQVMEQVHWHSKRKHLSRKIRGQATRRTLLIGLAALVLTLLPYLILLLHAQPAVKNASFAFLHDVQLSSQTLSAGLDFWVHFALYTSLAFGFLGALFSRLITLQRQWSAMALDELYNARSYHYIILRASIGILGALVVFFFLQSGLVKGAVFPTFSELSMTSVDFPVEKSRWPRKLLLPSPDLALLIMWSFLAGFSESLVPTVLSGTERQFGGAISPRQ